MMETNKLTKVLTEKYEPKMAIVIYESDSCNGDTYLERRQIDSKGRMGAGVPLTKKCITEVWKQIVTEDDSCDDTVGGKIPSNMLYSYFGYDKKKIVWYRPPEKRYLYFVKSLGIPNGEMIVPGLLYIVEDSTMKMYAFKGKKPTSKLYRAPFMNVDEKYVCLGNSKVEKPTKMTYENIIQYWEKMFWNSEFAHILGSNPIKGNLATVTKECICSTFPFPTDIMIPVSIKLKDILK